MTSSAEDPEGADELVRPPGSADRAGDDAERSDAEEWRLNPAVAAAAQRAKVTAARNIPVFDALPIPADTANLREGANLNDALLALLPLVGVWRGEGEGRGADGDYRF